MTQKTATTSRTTKKKGASKKIHSTPELPPRAQKLPAQEQAFELQTIDGLEPLAEQLGEDFVRNVTGADDAAEERREAETEEESGGPFVITTAGVEFAEGTDESNPEDATREPLPKV